MANKKLNATITIGGAISSSLGSAFGSVKGKVGEVGSALRKLETEQRMVTNAIQTFGRMGKNVDGLRARYVGLTGQVDRLRVAHERLQRVENAQKANLAKRADYRGQMVDAVAVGTAAAAPIVQAASFEKAMLGVAKQVQGARDESGKMTAVYYEMGEAIQKMGREIPIATNELVDMVTAGARMGVAREELLGFTRDASMMASAFELPAAQLAEDMGKISGLYKIPIREIGALADSINYLDDNAISKGGDIIDFLTRVGGSAATVKISGQQMASLGSTLLTLGERTETAGTAVNAMFSKFGAADKGTKKFKAAMAEIGLSTAAVQKGMQKNAEGTMLHILDQINKLPAEKRVGVMAELVGLEHSDTLAKLAANTAEYRKQIALAGSEKAKGSMSREFAATLGTTSAQFEIMKNKVTEVSVNIGSALLPAVNDLFSAITPLTSGIATFAKNHQTLTKVVVGTAVALVGLKVASIAAGYAFTFLRGGALQVAGVLAGTRAQMALTAISARAMGASAGAASGGLVGMATRALPMVAAGIRMVGVAFISTGVGAIIAGVALAGLAIYKNWDLVRSFFSTFGAGVVEGLAPVLDAGRAIIAGMAPIQPLFDMIGTAVGAVYTWFTSLLEPVTHSSEALDSAASAGHTFGQVLGAAINFALTPMRVLMETVTWIGTHIDGMLGKVGELGNAAKNVAGSAWESVKESVGLGPDPVPVGGTVATTDAQGAGTATPGAQSTPNLVQPIGAALGKAGADAAAAQDGAAGLPGANATLPTVPPMATARASQGGSYTDNSKTEINVTQQPGQSTRQLAEELTKIQEEKRAARSRGAMHDGAYQ